jgi:hypothetical protein
MATLHVMVREPSDEGFRLFSINRRSRCDVSLIRNMSYAKKISGRDRTERVLICATYASATECRRCFVGDHPSDIRLTEEAKRQLVNTPLRSIPANMLAEYTNVRRAPDPDGRWRIRGGAQMQFLLLGCFNC